MDAVFEFENMLFISSILKWYSPIITVIAMIISFVMAFKIRNKNGSINKKAVSIGSILIGISIALIVVLQLGIFNLESVDWYSDNGTYFGQVKDGKAQGNGRYFDENGNLIYKGEFNNNQYDGKGELYDVVSQGGKEDSVLYYEGEFENGYRTGKGKMYHTEGENAGELYYEGDFYQSSLNGKGTIYYSEDHIYEGGFAESHKHGFGKEIYTNSDGKEVVSYGTYSNDELNGHGEKYIDGVLRNEGEFINGSLTGQAILYYENGYIRYKGEFLDDKANGEGTLYSKTNEGEIVHQGKWENGEFIE